MRSSVKPTADDPADLYDAIALVKREEEQATLGTLSGDRKLSHYRFPGSIDKEIKVHL